MKKTFSFLLSFALVFTLLSCSKTEREPLDLADLFNEKNYEVKMFVDNEDLEAFSSSFEVSVDGIRCVISVVADNGSDYQRSGIFIYFDSTDAATRASQGLENCAAKNNFKENVASFTVKKLCGLVFIGCEDLWQDSLLQK